MHYVYVLKRESEVGYYIGYTSDLVSRFKKHNTRHKCKLIYYEAYPNSKLARQRELKLKQFGGAWRALRKRINLQK